MKLEGGAKGSLQGSGRTEGRRGYYLRNVSEPFLAVVVVNLKSFFSGGQRIRIA